MNHDLASVSFQNDGQSSWYKRVFFSWVRPLLAFGLKNKLNEKHFFPLNAEDEPANCSKKFNATLGKQTKAASPIYSALYADNKIIFWASMMCGILYCICNLWLIGLLKSFVSFIENPHPSAMMGAYFALGFCLVGTLCWVFIQHCFLGITKLSLRIRGALVLAIYEHLFKLKSSDRMKISAGETSNLMLQDAARVAMASQALVMLIVSIFLLLSASVLLYLQIGVSGIIGTISAFIVIPLSNVLNKRIAANSKSLMQISDTRISRMSELISRIKVVKAMSLSACFKNLIDQSRQMEIKQLKSLSWNTSLLNLVIQSSPLFIAGVTFAIYVALGKTLDLPTVLSAIAIFGLLKTPVMHIPRLIIQVTDAKVSIKRMENILKFKAANKVKLDLAELAGTVRFANANINWSDTAEPVLRNINVTIEPGSLVGIFGASGSGKSTLLNACFDEATVTAGMFGKSGSISIAQQKPFIISGTVRDNILFGLPLQEERYQQIIHCCHLDADLKEFSQYDLTSITESGGNLSGGQKQRIALARAIYRDADIYVLDDVFSALDIEVGLGIFNDAILTFLNGKTRIITSHRLDLIRQCDSIYKAENNSISNVTEEIAVKRTLPISSEPNKPTVLTVITPAATRENHSGSLMEEDRHIGKVSKSLYYDYFRKAGGIGVLSFVLLVFGIRELIAVSSDLWLSYASATSHFNGYTIVLVFSFLCILVATMTLFRSSLLLNVSIRVAEKVHNEMLDSILKAPVQFFELNSVGRVLNRFSKDMRTIDQEVGPRFLDAIGVGFVLLSAFFVIESANPFAIGVLLLVGYFYYKIQQYYRATAPEINRLEAISQSPLFSHVHETTEGVASIKAFSMDNWFNKQAIDKLRVCLRANFTQQVIAEWLSVNLDIMGVVLLGLVAFIATIAREHVSWSLAGLSVTYVLMVTINFQRAVHNITDLEVSMTSVERTHTFSTLSSETTQSNMKEIGLWPSRGCISFNDVTLVYHDNAVPVLKNVSFNVLSGEKIGVIGRTGSGKSSLVNALFRLVELQQGAIAIDDVDIANIDIALLRGSIALLPQEPLILAGTLRANLDPYHKLPDEILLSALKAVGIDSLPGVLTEGLGYQLNVGGQNLSQGHRQLLSLARILLLKPKILILDEATASVDVETDKLVQEVIRKNFGTTTIITIAHRIETIVDSDRILILEAGKVVDYSAPSQLFMKEGSRLYGFDKLNLEAMCGK